MAKRSHPDLITTLDYLAHVASGFTKNTPGCGDIASTPAHTWWHLDKLRNAVPAVKMPAWITWVDALNHGKWPDADDSELTDVCIAMQSYPSGTLIYNFKTLCTLREDDPSVMAMSRGIRRERLVNDHYMIRANRQMLRLLSDHNKQLLCVADVVGSPWYDAWAAGRQLNTMKTVPLVSSTQDLQQALQQDLQPQIA